MVSAIFLLINTFARSSWLLLFISSGIYLFFLIKKRKLKKVIFNNLILILAASIIMGIIFFKFGGVVLSRSNNFLDKSSMSTAGHIQTRGKALKFFAEKPVFGIGLGNFGVRLKQDRATSSSHAFLLTELAEGGMIGFLLLSSFLTYILIMLLKIFNRMPEGSMMRLYLFGLLVTYMTFFLNNIIIYDTLFRDTNLVIIALSVSAINIFSNSTKNEKDRSINSNCFI